MEALKLSENDIVAAFRQAMADAGMPCDAEIYPNSDKVERFTVVGDRKKSMNGFYILHTDGIPAGHFGCWKRGIKEDWCAKDNSVMTDDERSEYRRRIDQAKARRQQEADIRQAEGAEMANVIWDAAQPATDDHPYLKRKGIKAHGIRIGRWTRFDEATGNVWLDIADALLVPIKRGKVIVSLQAIFPDANNPLGRDKDFLPGGEKRGLCHSFGKASGEENEQVFVVCEGYATGATIHEATGYPVAVAFDAGNLVHATRRLRDAKPFATIIVAADNDRWTTQPIENPGVHFARQAADQNKAWLAVPEFDDVSAKPTDFNDLAAIQGNAAVAEQIKAAANPPPIPSKNELVPANDNSQINWRPDMSTVDWRSPMPECNSKGKPVATIENFRHMLDRLGVIIRYNVISKEEEILIPGEAFSIDNQANASLAWVISWCNRFQMPTGSVGDFITYLSDMNLHNPVANWIQSKPWDGEDRLQRLFDTIQSAGEAEDPAARTRKEFLMYRWMISAVAAAFRPNGVSAHGVLVFQGDQYLGKTAWFKRLVPSELGVIADGMMLKPDDKDSVKQAVSNWLVELGELDATFRKSDIAQLKSFLTRDKDVLRRAYARRESAFARRTVFFASVNPREFLHDATGNRRYWTIECEAINHSHKIDMQQVWAQVKSYYDSGDTWFLTVDEMAALNDSNQAFEVIDPISEKIRAAFNWDEPQTLWDWKTATQILQDSGIDRPTQPEATRAANIVRGMNGRKSKRTNTCRLLLAPSKRQTY